MRRISPHSFFPPSLCPWTSRPPSCQACHQFWWCPTRADWQAPSIDQMSRQSRRAARRVPRVGEIRCMQLVVASTCAWHMCVRMYTFCYAVLLVRMYMGNNNEYEVLYAHLVTQTLRVVLFPFRVPAGHPVHTYFECALGMQRMQGPLQITQRRFDLYCRHARMVRNRVCSSFTSQVRLERDKRWGMSLFLFPIHQAMYEWIIISHTWCLARRSEQPMRADIVHTAPSM